MFPLKKQMNDFFLTTMNPQVDLFSFVFKKKMKTQKICFKISVSRQAALARIHRSNTKLASPCLSLFVYFFLTRPPNEQNRHATHATQQTSPTTTPPHTHTWQLVRAPLDRLMWHPGFSHCGAVVGHPSHQPPARHLESRRRRGRRAQVDRAAWYGGLRRWWRCWYGRGWR